MPTVLVVHDDPELAAACRRLEAGSDGGEEYRFVFTATLAQALAHLTAEACANPFDIALISVSSTDAGTADPFNFLQRVQDLAPELALIALAPAADLAAVRRAMNLGAADFLTLPIDAGDLSRTMDRIYADIRARRRDGEAAQALATIRRELGIAEGIQQGILPGAFKDREDLDVFAQMTPAREMGGDFYDFLELDDGRLGLVVADVVGKGVPAAFFMAVAHTVMRATALAGALPGACLERVNSLICRDNIPGMLVSAFYGVLDTATWELVFANAGHPPPCIVYGATGEVSPLSGGDGVIMGVEDGLSYGQGAVTLGPGESLFCYTDGLTEAFNAERDPFTEDRLIQPLLEGQELSAQAMAVNVFAAVDRFTYGAPQNDDITCLVVKRR